MDNKTIGFVIPAYNPSGKWADYMVERLYEIKKLLGNDIDIILVISPDGSVRGHSINETKILEDTSIIKKLILLENKENKGKGNAVRVGLENCSADYYIYTDWDFPFTNESYRDVINTLISGDTDVVLPFRRNYICHLSWFRKILSKLSRLSNKILFMLPSNDTQAGLKGFNNVGKETMLSTSINTYLFDTEFVVLSNKKGLRIENVDVDIRDGIQLSSMRMKVILIEIGNIFKILYKKWFC